MKLIIGLGNPGNDYFYTRHNVGFRAIDFISAKYGIALNQKNFQGLFGKGNINNEEVILLKPQTFMNSSGECIKEIIDFYKINIEDIIVIYDDISLGLAKIRIRKKGSAGGHNGIKSIINCLGTSDFSRIKIGLGENTEENLIDFVLGEFSEKDFEKIKETFPSIIQIISFFISNDLDSAMCKFN